jgi:hypothetical protein
MCLILARNCVLLAASFLNNLAFLYFQSSHATSVKRVSVPFLLSPCHLCLQCSHQSMTEHPPTYEASTPNTARMVHQMCLEKEHEEMMWSMVSGSWSHR